MPAKTCYLEEEERYQYDEKCISFQHQRYRQRERGTDTTNLVI